MQPKLLLGMAFTMSLGAAWSQDKPLSDSSLVAPRSLQEVVVNSQKFSEKYQRIAQQVEQIRSKNLLHLQPNVADVLTQSGKLFVQKSQQGGGSPVIRGFEASRILLMVDGIRMNTAIFRAGHLQNIITVDNMVLDRLEVLYGPSSTLYGSDALGGVVSMFTIDPRLSTTGKTEIHGAATLRYTSAIDEQRGNLQFHISGKKWASFTSLTQGSFGDAIQGNRRRAAYPNFGKQDFIVQRVGNTDVAVPNPNPNQQIASGYKQTDITQKILFQPNDKIKHLLNIQLSTSSDIPRYDRLTEKSAGLPAFAEWYYGPQVRNMVAYHFTAKQQNGFFQDIKATASYQDVQESRITRRFQSNNKDSRWEKVDLFGFNLDLKHSSDKHELQVGAESYTNFVRSTAERRNIVSGALSRITTRYADGPTSMASQALYAQHTYKINSRWTLNDGLRLNAVQLNAVFVDTTLTRFPFTRARQNNLALTGNLGLVYVANEKTRSAFLLSSGFRSPNVDDLSKVFDTRVGAVVVPNADLKPEYTYNAEWNLNHYGKAFQYGGAIFATAFRNALVVDKFQLNGQDSIVFNGIRSGVFAVQNKARAFLWGVNAHAGWTFLPGSSIDGVVTYTHGRYTDQNGVQVPLDHIPPVYGRVGIKHVRQVWNAEFYALFNGWKRLGDYNPNGEDNLQYATPDGMPAWTTLNIRVAANLGKSLSLQVLLDNLTDLNYRYFASGYSAAGRNVSVSLRLRW